ncbi:RHS repeat-associated core domain-containing protein [Chishuiella changwenlii]|uniref:RHS repeat-associated core domain-containing protein n=1 Tax=Chishuiella changwenlii TaxID=1434701 RepID=UPI002FD8F7CF
MIKKIYLLFYFLYGCFAYLNAQTVLNNPELSPRVVKDPNAVILTSGFHVSSNDISGVFRAKIGERPEVSGGPSNSNAGNENPSGTTSSGTNFHDTSGNIDVDGGGQLQYTFPIALPPGIKSVAPQINLIYSSNSTNGIAGYGWSLSGTTSISRMGRNLEKDGVIKGIDLNYNDLFQFNGQRLVLVSGEYGKDGATYKTEKFSNIRIKSVGAISGKDWNGPSYFEVTFEDGSQAWYGSTNTSINAAITPVEYNIVKWKDAQGNYISYDYIQSENVSLISKINWGGNETIGKPHFNSIIFNYKNRSLVETSYLNANNKGIRFLQSKLLNDITVNVNGSLFKKYTLAHSTSHGSNYEIVNSITEHNSNNEAANPVTFTYEGSSIKPWTSSNIVDPNHHNNEGELYGDFDGDGEIDLIVNEGKDLYLYKKVFFRNSQKILIGSIDDLPTVDLKLATTFTIKNNKNQIVPRTGFILLYQGRLNRKYKRHLIVSAYLLDPITNKIKLEYRKLLHGNRYDRIGDNYNHNVNGSQIVFNFDSSDIKSVNELTVGNDGSNGIILNLESKVNRVGRFTISDPIQSSVIIFPNNPNLNDEVIRDEDNSLAFYNDLKGDFDGDGIVDYIKIHRPTRNNSGSILITSLKQSNNLDKSSYSIIKETYNGREMSLQGDVNGAVVGDFNGDGKSDLLIPKANESSDWLLYLSNGKGFEAPQTINNLAYYSHDYREISKGRHRNFFTEPHCRYSTREYFSFYAEDLDNDGRAELIALKRTTLDHSWSSHWTNEWTKVETSVFSTVRSSNSNLNFSLIDRYNRTFQNMNIPFGITSIYKNGNSTVLIGKPDDCKKTLCDTFTFVTIGGTQDIASLRKMNSVSQGGITTSVTYKELDPVKNPNFYKGELLTYPYIGSERLAGSFVVSQLQQEDRKQDFYYRNMTMQMLGKGMLGFQQQARSSWYVNGLENTKIWSVSQMDPYNEGVTNKEWSIRVSNNDVNRIFTTNFTTSNQDLIAYSETEYSYNYFLPNGNKFTTKPTLPTPNLITAVVPTKVISVDNLKDIRSTETVIYNNYYLPEVTVANVNNGYGTTTTTLNYSHNENGSGKDYYIGRPLSKKIVNQAYGKSSSSYETYTYNENFISSKKIYDQNLSSFIQENYLHDGFGNLVQKDLSNSVSSEKKTVKTAYDSQGKFVISTTDNLGLVNSMTYNNWGQLLTETDPLGNRTTNTYDGWGKMLTSNHNLSGTTTYRYEKDSNGNIKTTVYSPTGNYTINYINKLGQEYKTSTKGFNQGKIVSKETLYDAIGREIKESEPYFEGESQKWNTITYNDAVYPAIVSATSFTGKKMTTTVNKMTTTIKEDNGYGRITSQETDALGNVIRSTDAGGSITFTYNAANQQISANYGSNVVTTKYDNWGRRSEFHDPSNGLYKYFYDVFGNSTGIESPKGKKEYVYNAKDQLISQIETANDGSTAKNIHYTYNAKGLLIKKAGTAKNIKGIFDTYSSSVTYDLQGRVVESVETSNGRHFMQKEVKYDDKGRVIAYEKGLYSRGKYTKAVIENVYDTWSGTLYQVKDKASGALLWQLDEVLAGGQVIKTKLGKSTIHNQYDYNNMLSSIKHTSVSSPQIVDVAYTFDVIKNELTSRITSGDFSINERFSYDNNNRLVEWTNPTTGNFHKNIYDQEGRITENNQIGKINFGASGSVYRPTSIDLNTEGIQHYTNDQIQTIGYNENNDPTFIDGVTGDAAFSYGLTNMRQVVSYGGNFSTATEGKFTKFYSEDGSFEVTVDNTTGQEKHILYIGGSPYEADILYLKDYSKNEASYHYLHKDYLGSILAITDENGRKLEQRHYDAWGNITHLKIGTGAVITDQTLIKQTTLLLDRGYTSHEHFQELGIIHMNGRLYDPILRRFLNADENIQEPFNTQNYNKYGYVLNNPLLYNDPSGEEFMILGSIFLAKMLIGAGVGAGIGLATYTLNVGLAGGEFKLGGMFKSMMWGAISGAVTAGIGNVFTTSASGYTQATKFAAKTMGGIVKAGAHAIAQGTLSMMQGGNFYQAFASGAAGSLAAAGWGNLAKMSIKTAHFAQSTLGMVTFGAISGGASSYLTGGNFWQGFIIGGTVAGLNDGFHKSQKTHELLLLNDREGVDGFGIFGHGAAAVGNKSEGYYYYSNDGTDDNMGIYGKSNKAYAHFDSRQDLLNDSKVPHGTTRYDRALVFKVTAQDANNLRVNMGDFLKNNYNVVANNCAHIWNVALKTINYNFSGNGLGPNAKFKALKFFYWPSLKYETRISNKW